MYKNWTYKNEIIKNESIKNERLKNELIKKRTDPVVPSTLYLDPDPKFWPYLYPEPRVKNVKYF